MPRGRRKGRGGQRTTSQRGGGGRRLQEEEEEGPIRREKESRLEEEQQQQHNTSVFNSFFRFSSNFGRPTATSPSSSLATSSSSLPTTPPPLPPPLSQTAEGGGAFYCAPMEASSSALRPLPLGVHLRPASRSPSKRDAAAAAPPPPLSRSSSTASSASSSSSSSMMPVLTPQVPLAVVDAASDRLTPPPLVVAAHHHLRHTTHHLRQGVGGEEEEGPSDQASDRSEGDSGKENDVEDIPWRGSRTSINSRSSRASRPRSGPFIELNGAANILQPASSSSGSSSSATAAGGQPDKKVGLSEQQQPNGGRVTRSSRRTTAIAAAAGVRTSTSLRLASSSAVGNVTAATGSAVPATSGGLAVPSQTAKEEATTTGLLTSPTKLVLIPPAGSGLQSPLSPHKIQLQQQQRHTTLAEKFRNAISAKSPKTFSSSSTKKGQQSRQAATAGRKSSGGVSENKTAGGGGRTKAEKLAAAGEGSRQITDFFPIRRSERKPKSELDKDKMENIEAQLLAPTDDAALGLEVRDIPNKGRGVVATRHFKKGEFVVEYAGELIDIGSAKDREAQYSLDTSKGCYMYYFAHREKQYCIDATTESGRYGRLLNHSCKTPNCVTKVVMLGDLPRLILIAKQDIPPDTELLYDYGDRSKESLLAHPWLAL